MKKKSPIGTNQNELEKLAQAMFQRYSLDFNGQRADWKYLGDNKKVFWIKEAEYFSKYVLERIKKHLASPIKFGPAQTTFEAAYNQGLQAERFSLIEAFQQLEEDLSK